MEQLSDKELLGLFLQEPSSEKAKAAKEVLEYRKHIEIMQNNRWLSILTVILALAAIAQVIIDLAK